jgi:hypothetical protein
MRRSFVILLILAQIVNSCGDVSSEEETSSSCGIPDDTLSATIDYYNPETGFSNTYTLNVVVNDCEVIEIDFPKGGWLDEDHINAAQIDEEGNATVEDDQGRTFEVHIDKGEQNSDDK